jgi:hypothetical protein
MPEFDYDEVTANEATGFSGFGGHLLAQADGAVEGLQTTRGGDFTTTLADLGIEDIEQLVAIAAIPEVREELQSVLGRKTRDFRTLVDQMQEVLPADRLAAVSTPAPKDMGLGVLPPTPEMEASAEASARAMEIEGIDAEAVALPASVNLIPFMQPIRNQGSRGTCVSFTLTALNEYILRRRNMLRDLSEQHLYYEIKLIDGAPGGCGTWQVKAVNALRLRGQCRETVWPYNPNLPCNNHGARPFMARLDGLHYRLNTLAVPARSVLAYKMHMAKQRPVTISIPVWNSWYQSAETRRSGRITMRIGNEQAVGGHAVLLVGYQDTLSSPGGGFFLVRNSWGTSGFGYQCPFGAGYGTIPYQYIINDAYLGESFTAVVPGITIDEQDAGEGQVPAESSAVTIQVGSNIKITISGT